MGKVVGPPSSCPTSFFSSLLLLLLLLPKKKILLAVWLWLLVNPNGIVCAAQLLCVASGQKQIDGPCRTDRARRLYISPPCYRKKGPAHSCIDTSFVCSVLMASPLMSDELGCAVMSAHVHTNSPAATGGQRWELEEDIENVSFAHLKERKNLNETVPIIYHAVAAGGPS